MRLFGLIGYPLSHSFSPSYFAEKFRKLKIEDAEYRVFPLENIDEINKLIKNSELQGFNITIPYKEQIIRYLDEIDEIAAKIGAVNTVKIIRDVNKIKLIGYNTDAKGFQGPLEPLLKEKHYKALILGTGGASKAVAFVLDQLEIDFMFVSRTPVNKNMISYNEITEKTMEEYHLIINTSPIGMFPNIENCPDLPYQYISGKHILYDLIYNPLETKFMQLGKTRGAKVENGLKMLHLQADKAWEIWNK